MEFAVLVMLLTDMTLRSKDVFGYVETIKYSLKGNVFVIKATLELKEFVLNALLDNFIILLLSNANMQLYVMIVNSLLMDFVSAKLDIIK